MRAVMFPDSEAVAVVWLNADVSLGGVARTNLVGWAAGQARVVVTRIGGTPSVPYRVDEPRLDVSVYAETKESAHDLAQRARVRLHDMPSGDFRVPFSAVVLHVDDEVGLRYLPDPDTTTPRYLLTVRLSVRPHP